MDSSNKSVEDYLQGHKDKIIENINRGKDIGVNKISAILVMDDEAIQSQLITWLIKEGYKVSLKKEDYNILIIEW